MGWPKAHCLGHHQHPLPGSLSESRRNINEKQKILKSSERMLGPHCARNEGLVKAMWQPGILLPTPWCTLFPIHIQSLSTAHFRQQHPGIPCHPMCWPRASGRAPEAHLESPMGLPHLGGAGGPCPPSKHQGAYIGPPLFSSHKAFGGG